MMSRVASHLLAATAAVVFLAACAAPKPITPAPHVYVDGLDVTAMQSVFKHGMDEIKARAYDEQNMVELFRSAVSNLQKLDASLSVTSEPDHVALRYNGAETKVPVVYGDTVNLATGLLDTVLAARKQSSAIKDADEEAVYKTVFPPMLAKIDVYSHYATRRDASLSRLLRDGVIGLGLEVAAVPAGAWVKAIVVDGPGAKAGVKSNDVIVKVNGINIARKRLADIRQMLDGSTDTLVHLELRRLGQRASIQIDAKRDLIVPDTVTSTLNNGVVEMQVHSFNQRTGRAVSQLVTDARKANGGTLKGLIIDLRGDPGGLLDQAIEMADLFLDNGVIAVLKGRHPGAQQFYAAHRGDVADGAPVVILTDGRTASAAEIAAAALQDNGRAVVVGTESLGKGSVQNLIGLPNGGELSITWAHVTTPRGTLLHGLGVLPDVCVGGDAADAKTLSSQTLASLEPSAETRRGWTAAGLDETARRNLRATCPAQANPERAADMDVARLLLRDPTLMAALTTGRSAQLAVKP